MHMTARAGAAVFCRALAATVMLLATAGLIFSATTAHAIEAGQVAPDIELPGMAGVQSLSELKGKLVYVDFWASWCGPCKQSFPWMNQMQRKYAERGLHIVAINLDAKRADAELFLLSNPAAFALAFDSKGESAKRWAIKGMPTSVLVAADGKVLWVHQGFRLDQRAELEAKLAAALGLKAP